MSKQQKAVLVKEIGKPIVLGETNIPIPADDEVLVKVAATMLLPHDAYGRDWGLFIENKLPAVLGSNIAGKIDQVGRNVTKFRKGDKVFGLANPGKPDNGQAGLQTYSTLPSTAIARIPEGFTAEQVVTLPVNLVTSFQALFTKSSGFGFKHGAEKSVGAADQTLVIIGAGAVVGKFAIQLAKFAGIGKIIAIAGSDSENELKKMGATYVVDRRLSQEAIVGQVHSITGKDSVTNIYECRSMSYELAANLLAEGKKTRLVTVHPADKNPSVVAAKRPDAEMNFIEGSSENLGELEGVFWRDVGGWLKDGWMLPAKFSVVEGLDKVDEMNAALDGYMAGTGGPQLVVKLA
ncbi:hypothetical protein CBER1_06447 [Cercospora berteroae]|uniref:Enoyl reductase (ER) domain-containing protein n=1 Tax=Cercospora berteroae TaxID=357750 RepID=A0A2S6BS75_9PEZI|nr:hypothetical protein CBER1_06447 [Cercospora berteroae]